MTRSHSSETNSSEAQNSGQVTRFFEGYEGRRLEYSWVAEVTREPTPLGLDGGRILYLSITQDIATPSPPAPGLSNGNAGFQATAMNSRTREVARFEHGQLTCHPEARAFVDRIKETFTNERAKDWGPAFGIQDRSEPRRASRPDRSRAKDDFERAR